MYKTFLQIYRKPWHKPKDRKENVSVRLGDAFWREGDWTTDKTVNFFLKKILIYYPFAKFSNNPHFFVFTKASL